MKSGKLRVLVVDDEVDACVMIGRYLAKTGYEASIAHNGADAVAHVKNNPVDVVILDIRMPGEIDGTKALHQIKKFNEDIVVIMLTAIEDAQTALLVLKEGASDFLRKPIMFEELSRSINSSLEKQRLIEENREYQKRLEEKVAEQTDILDRRNETLAKLYFDLKKANLEIVRALSETIEAKDPYTKGHCRRVTAFSLRIGKAVGLTQEQLEALEYGSLLHDIGKIGIRGAVLNKPDGLTEEEYNHVKSHPQIGENIISNLESLKGARSVILHHHERYDGKGYPGGLRNIQLDILPRIVIIADAYDAMTSDRPYRKGMTRERALAILEENKGKQFDPELVDIFIGNKLYFYNEGNLYG